MNISSGSECATPSECGNDGDASPDGLAAEQTEILYVDSDSEATVSVPSIIDDEDIYFNEGSESDIIVDDLDDKKPGARRDDFIEIFSRPRLIPRISALHLGMVASMSVDILTGFDLLLPEKRQEIMTYLWARRPRSAMLSPPCTMFSQLMNTNWARMDPAVVKARWQEAMVLLKFALDVAPAVILYWSIPLALQAGGFQMSKL